MNRAEAQFAKDAAPIVTAMKDEAVSRIEKLLAAGDMRELADFDLRQTESYRALVLASMRRSYEFGKKTTADELNVGSPSTSRLTNTLIVQQVNAGFDKQMNDLVFGIKTAVLTASRATQLASTDLGLTDVLRAVATLFATFQTNNVPLTAAWSVSVGMSMARRDVFLGQHDNLASYTWSALLDERTCVQCISLDGTTVDYAEYVSTPWQPPLHFNCRCIWVATTKDDANPPDITGMPEAPGGTTSAEYFNSHPMLGPR